MVNDVNKNGDTKHYLNHYPQKRRDTLLGRAISIIRKVRELQVSGELGIATAEYAVTTVAACGFAGVLYKLLSSESIAQLIGDLLRRALSTFLL
jgi:hypothetical protein